MDTATLNNALDQIVAGNYSTRIDETTVGDELRPLAGRLNAALAALEGREEAHQKELRETAALKRRFTLMIRDNPLAIAVLRPDKSRIDINDEYARMWRGTRKETLAKKIYDYDVTILDGEHFYACYETKQRTRTTVLAKWPDGVKKYLTLNAIPILDEKGEIEVAFYVWNDTTHEHDLVEQARDKAAWYESILDAVPFPVSVTDLDTNWTFINRAVETFIGKKRAEVLGRPCREWNANICNTSNCGITCLRRGQQQTFFEQSGGNFQVDTSYVRNARGENVGHVEVVQDISSTVKVANYMDVEVQRLAGNLSRLAAGNLEFDTAVAPADRYTEEVRQNFVRIAESLVEVRGNIGAMLEDAAMLAQAAQDGNLRARADVARHEGEYRRIVEGVNAMLDSVIAPLNVAADFITDVSMGNELEKVTGDYRGDYARIKESINRCREILYGVLGEITMLTQAAVDGRLETRGDTRKFDGAWVQMIGGINATLDAVVGPINEAKRVSEEYANGNFRARVDGNLKVAGDFVAFKKALDNIGVQVSATLAETSRAIVQVEEGTAETSKGSEEIAKAAEQVSNTSQRCADLAKQVLDRIEAVDRQMADLSASNEEIASTSQNVLERAQNAARQGHQAQGLGDEASKKMQIVEGIAQQSVEEIEGLNARMREINNIVKLITDIANQVNLLALNAAIEAARAGEHGRGFAVVAGEVRNLAGEAKSATRQIEDVIGGIRASSQKTAAAIKSAHTEVGAGVSSVNKTIEALNTIISEAEVVAHGLGEIARATEDQANATNNAVQGMAEGTRLTKEMQNQMDDLAALAEEASASTEEIGSAAHEINRMARGLKGTMDRFQV
ncbi:PAS domain S-box protein [Methanoculleus sp. Wushi-C6]|uniref:PAS domain S-box protein n=1 Tax=Methanoculleus caldifontis TaxID=2651577 RepID=A0ABU3X4N2_9EURY|nr:methyl-accepting chemotaxis protein [Methanoculleus sp. Wushi-C6]MDV2482765.1 PAS domain S-box protein [Methanoculleus sp. Wushi-C6]